MSKTITVNRSKVLAKALKSKQPYVADGFKIMGVLTGKQIEKKIVEKEMTACSYDLELFERLIKVARSLERADKSTEYGYEIFMPKNAVSPFIVHGTFSDNYYALAPRVHMVAKIREQKKK